MKLLGEGVAKSLYVATLAIAMVGWILAFITGWNERSEPRLRQVPFD